MHSTLSARWFLVLPILGLAACSADPDGAAEGARAVASSSPVLAKGDGTGAEDTADRDCQVVLRSMGRAPTSENYEQDCSSGVCHFVWRGTVDVAEGMDPGASVRVLYRMSADPQWWEVGTTFDGAVVAGYRRHAFAISEHLFGPDDTNTDTYVIDVVAFVLFSDGDRLFDHNRFEGDFDNARLDTGSGFGYGDEGTCQPIQGTVWFPQTGEPSQNGLLHQGGFLRVAYDIDRLPDCRGTHNGFPAWDVVAYAKFLPGNQVVSGTVRQLGNVNGVPNNEATDLPFVTRIPADALYVELWFHNYSGAGSSCQAWDSNFGANFVFEVMPPVGDPRCQDVEKETGARTEDYRMAHNQEYCFAYRVDAQVDADSCEFFLEGFGDGYVGHYGIPFRWMLAYLRVHPQDGELLNVGMYTRYRDLDTGKAGERFSLAIREQDNLFRAGFAYLIAQVQSQQGCNYQVDEFAWFIDVRRPSGQVVRLWQSRHGNNYGMDDAFSLPVSVESIPYGNIRWSNASSTVFEWREDCSQ